MLAARSNPLDVKFGLCVGLGTHHVKTTSNENQNTETYYNHLLGDFSTLRIIFRTHKFRNENTIKYFLNTTYIDGFGYGQDYTANGVKDR